MKNVLVTGAGGYIGQNLIKHLEKRGCRTFPYDIRIREWDRANIEDFKKYDGVVHLAALSGILACQKDIDTAIMDNIIISFKILERSLESKIPVVFTSSQSAKEPVSSIYATMKRTVELIARDVMNRGGDVKVLRLSNVYGGFEYVKKKQTVIKQFLVKRAKGDIILIHGDGRQERDFIHVDDVCEFIWLALSHKDRILDPIDIGTGIGTNMIDLARMCRHHSAFTDRRDVGETSGIADVTKSKELFGYTAPNRIQSYLDTDPSLLS